MSESKPEEPSPDGPDSREPVVAEPVAADPVAADPAAADPVATDPTADPTTESNDPRERAADPARRRQSRTAADALSDALTSLQGLSVSAHTVILGDASVGTLVGRDQHRSSSGSGLVPSGPVSSKLLEHLENTFVPPPRFEEVRHRLGAQPLLLLRAPRGWGRTAAALRALTEECAAGVHKLNPDVRLRSLEIEFTPKTGYLLESLGFEQARALYLFHLEELSRTLTEHSCRMIVVLDGTAELSADADPFLLEGGEPADAKDLVRRHLLVHLPYEQAEELLERTEVAPLLAYAAQDRLPARDLALLAAELADVVAGRLDIANVVNRHSASADSRFRQWFDDELDTEARAFAIALAVFNRMPLHIVSRASRMLALRIAEEEASDDDDEDTPARPVFGVRSTEMLRKVQAELYQSTEDTEFGRIRVQAARFVDDRYPRRILEHVWQEYHDAHELVREWLRELGNDPDLWVCTHVGVAVGLLATFEFEHARQLVIEPWADSGRRHDRLAAIGALQFPSLHPELAPMVTRMLTAWSRKDQPLARRVTAAAALGSTIGQTMPDRAIKMLRRAARSGQWEIQDAVCYSMLQLFKVTELTGRVLTELLQWTESQELNLRGSGFSCVLWFSFDLEVDTPRGALPWPVMIWLADESADHRPDLITLFARLMEAPYYLPAAYREIRRWVRISEKDRQLRGPLGRLLSDLGQAIQDTEILRRYLRDWAAERKGPEHAVKELLTMLDSEDTEDESP